MSETGSASSDANTNPFLALFDSINKNTFPVKEKPQSHLKELLSPSLQRTNDFLEEVFGFTINHHGMIGRKFRDGGRLHLSDLSEELGQHQRSWLDLDILERAVFERLMMSVDELNDCAIFNEDCSKKSHITEKRCILYLATCYERVCELGANDLHDLAEKVENIIVANMVTAFQEPEIFEGQDLNNQIMKVIKKGFSETSSAIPKLISNLLKHCTEEQLAKRIMSNMFHSLKKEFPNNFGNLYEWANLTQLTSYIISGDQYAQKLFLEGNFPVNSENGRDFGETIIGCLLSASCLPKYDADAYLYFENPSRSLPGVHKRTEEMIWASAQALHDRLFEFFNALLRGGPEVNHLTLLWIGKCLKANEGRAKLWNMQMRGLTPNLFAPDGLMLNLGAVLLRLCDPFTTGGRNKRLLKIKLEYHAQDPNLTEADRKERQVHSFGMDKESCILTSEAPLEEKSSLKFNFVTDIYFLTQKCICIGHRVLHEKFVKLNQELNRLQQVLAESAGANSEEVHDQFSKSMTKYLCMKAALLEPSSLSSLFNICSATAALLVHYAFVEDKNEDELIGLSKSLPEDKEPKRQFFYVPEYFIENMCETMLLLKRFCPSQFEESGELLPIVADWILTFMGSPEWIKNPHLRAKLAESLDCLLPHHKMPGASGMDASFQREKIFVEYENRLLMVDTLLHVFVDIEATGQAVEFELKFSYRKPMYDVMRYLLDIEEYRQRFKNVARAAEERISDAKAPLFLRFVNLLINDAIFLLDEALNYMKQIQELEKKRDEEWPQLPQRQRAENEANFQHIGRLARYHNVMGMETITLFSTLTHHIVAIFTHPTMVDRIAAMLNYFLKHLVGPERRALKVKNLEEYEFRPAEIVSKISSIYINFTDCPDFIAAVSQDGRSYSPDLFGQAFQVLTRIGKFDLLTLLQEVASKVRASSDSQTEEETLFADAPDEYLDPIMAVLMRDPVKLPTSGQIVDRQTISRHLLSDQNDPFNRMPLTMDKVIPQDDLRKEIEEWMESKRK